MKAISPYLDVFTVSVDSAAMLQLYNDTHKPIVWGDYSSANPDSQLYFDAVISSITYNPITNQTIIYAPGIHYEFRQHWYVYFPALYQQGNAAFKAGGACHNMSPSPPLYEPQKKGDPN